MTAASRQQKRSKSGGKSRKKGVALLPLAKRVAGILFLLLLLGISMFMVGYVIFFRTVVAQEIVPSLRNSVVFEEPDPPPSPEKSLEVVEHQQVQTPKTAPIALPKVAIIIDDLGYDESLFRRLLQLPYSLTFSFLPFAPLTPELEKEAYFSGRVVFLHLPLEPRGEQYNPGPGALFLDDSADIQREKLSKAVAMVPHAIGINNHMGSRFTENQTAMDNVLTAVKDKGMIYVDSVTSAESVAYRTARGLGIRSLRRNVFLDNELNPELICQQLAKLVAVAEKKGAAIGIAHPHEETVQALSQCLPVYDDRITVSSIPGLLP